MQDCLHLHISPMQHYAQKLLNMQSQEKAMYNLCGEIGLIEYSDGRKKANLGIRNVEITKIYMQAVQELLYNLFSIIQCIYMYHLAIIRNQPQSTWSCTLRPDLHTVSASLFKPPAGSTICTGTCSLSNSDHVQFCGKKPTPFEHMIISQSLKEKIMARNVFVVFLEKEKTGTNRRGWAFHSLINEHPQTLSVQCWIKQPLDDLEVLHSPAFPQSLISPSTWHFTLIKNMLYYIHSVC